MSEKVTGSARNPTRAPVKRLGWRTDFWPSRMHSGHWKPTEAGVMQSGQMERLQR
ncbi:hypothetical protein GCM10007979_19100 [Nocardioides albus]|nr:hypothetical protein GCM10007979_19100 [Nocardioides albus]